MPIYTFRNKVSGEISDIKMRVHEYEEFSDPNLERYFDQAPSLGDPVRLGLKKPGGAFNEVLAKIHERTYKSTLNSKLSRNP